MRLLSSSLLRAAIEVAVCSKNSFEAIISPLVSTTHLRNRANNSAIGGPAPRRGLAIGGQVSYRRGDWVAFAGIDSLRRNR